MAKVYIKFNSAVIKEVKLDKDEMTFGRKPTNDIVIDHPTISGFHGKIHKEGDHYVVEDLNSTNGTFINGQRVKNRTLKDKDQIGVAGHIFDFHIDNAAETSADPAPAQPSTAAAAGASVNADKQKEMLQKSSLLSTDQSSDGEKVPTPGGVGVVRIISGGVDGQTEVHLKDLVTYIGTTDQALIKIKGFLVPSLAAAISRRPDGFFLKAVKAGYPKVNGAAIQEQVLLENGALIEVGGTNMVFYRGNAKKTS